MPVFCASSCTTSTGAPSPLLAFLPCGQAHPASTSFSTTSMWPTAAAIWAALPVFGSARLTSAPAAAWQAAQGSLSTPHEAAVHMRDSYDIHKDAQHADPLSQCKAHSRPNGTTQVDSAGAVLLSPTPATTPCPPKAASAAHRAAAADVPASPA